MKQSNFYFTQFLLSLCFKLAYVILAKILTAIPCEILSLSDVEENIVLLTIY